MHCFVGNGSVAFYTQLKWCEIPNLGSILRQNNESKRIRVRMNERTEGGMIPRRF